MREAAPGRPGGCRPVSRSGPVGPGPEGGDDRAERAVEDTGDLSQPEAGAGLRDPVHLPGVHLPLPPDRPARLRHVHRSATSPTTLCVELKSLKLYLWSFRDEGHFHEAVTNRILDDLVAAVRPRRMRVEGDFNVRGGIHTVVTADHDG